MIVRATSKVDDHRLITLMHRGHGNGVFIYTSRQVRATGAANDEPERHKYIANWQFGMFEALKHGGHRSGTDAGTVLVNGGKRHRQQACVSNIVHAQ